VEKMVSMKKKIFWGLIMNSNDIIQRLKEGNSRFVADKLDDKLQHSKRRESLTSGQSPYAIVLGCSDSRVIPEFIFDVGLGEIFTIRVAGNIANISSIASIEYAVVNFKPRAIIVLGHENCGAVTAALAGGDQGSHLNHLLAHINPANEFTEGDDILSITKKNAHHSASELFSKSLIISDAVKCGQLKILPAYYHFVSGQVDFLME